MNRFNFGYLLRDILVQFPVILVCLAGLVVVMINWRKAGNRSLWPALGFGLGLVFCFALPILRHVFWGMIRVRFGDTSYVLFSIFCSCLDALPYLAFLAGWFLECRARSEAAARGPDA
jgi:hypothetical protein